MSCKVYSFQIVSLKMIISHIHIFSKREFQSVGSKFDSLWLLDKHMSQKSKLKAYASKKKTNGKINQSRKTSNKRIKLSGRMIDYALYRLNIVNNDSDHLLHV